MMIEEEILKTENARVRIIELSAKARTQWHSHTEMTDDCFCLEGNIAVHLKDPDQTVSLAPGERCTIESGRIHRVENQVNEKSRYLLVQGVGKYDFVEYGSS